MVINLADTVSAGFPDASEVLLRRGLVTSGSTSEALARHVVSWILL